LTIANCIRLYNKYVEEGNEAARLDMHNHICKCRKFVDHAFVKEIQLKKEEKREEIRTKAKEDGKKSKR